MSVQKRELIVDPSQAQDGTYFPTIQSAINALPQNGGAIHIAPGVYNENLVSVSRSGVYLVGMGTVGPGLVQNASAVVIQAKVGTVLDIGSDSYITDPGWTIEGIEFAAPDDGVSLPDYGVRVRRMRGLVMRDVQFRNFRTATGAALFLDGGSGYNEWATLDNVNTSICQRAMLLSNATACRIIGGALLNVYEMSGSVGIETAGPRSDTVRVMGTCLLEYDTAIKLNGNPNEMARVDARIENHTNPQSVAVQVFSSNNLVAGTVYGTGTGVRYEKTATGNQRLGFMISAVKVPVTDLGIGNQ